MFVQEHRRNILFMLTNITAKRDPLLLVLPLIKICQNLDIFSGGCAAKKSQQRRFREYLLRTDFTLLVMESKQKNTCDERVKRIKYISRSVPTMQYLSRRRHRY